MDPELLDLPLGVKIPVLPGSKPVFSRAKLGEKLHRPSCYFDLGDPYCRLMRAEYNSLHDPHLQAYHKRKDNIRRLKREGYVTSDGKERLRQHLAKLKDAPKPPRAIDPSRLAERLLQPHKPSCPPPPKSSKIALKSGRCRRVELSETFAPDRRQDIGLVAKEFAATKLKSLGKRLASGLSESSEPGLSARRKEQPTQTLQLGHRRQHLGEGATGPMDPELLDLPLGVKIPVLPGSKPVFSRAKLGEKLHRPSCYFDLGDPYCRLMRAEYNSLHDPHLQAYHKRKDNIRRLKREGYVTSDGKVVCTLKEFNEYRQYLTTLKLEAEKTFRREEERLRQHLAKLKDAPKPPRAIDPSRLAERLLQPHKPSCPPPPKSSKIALKSGRCRRVKAALDEGQTYCQPELGQEGAKLPRRVSCDADSESKPDVAADGVFKALFEQQTATEAQQLEEVATTVVQEVLERVKAPQDQSVCILRRAALGIRGRMWGSAGRAEPSETSAPDRRQEIGLAAKELVATVLESLGKRLASGTSEAWEPGLAARRKEQPIAGGATRAGKSEEEKWGQAERAASNGASSQAALDQLTREVVDSVCCALESFVASRFERDSSCKYSEILELPRGNVSNRQLQPSQVPFSRQGLEEGRGFPRASEQQSLEASKGVKLPVLQPLPNTTAADVCRLSRTIASESIHNAVSRVQQRHAERAGYARTIVPEVLGRVTLERETKPEPGALANALAIKAMASRIVDSALERICQPGPAVSPGLNFGRRVARPPAPRDGKESYPAEDALPSMGPQFSRQPVPPAGPKPPAQTGARRRAARVKLA
ncbi:hypothetical protein QYF61_018293 [Mycteria americana]|uniref:Uncharacterized protein n=1 Tax=Mycteria americana TaxID=33587 RepID=A0AAN7MT89_MYCAM|nr:hypothetical protein QYF61_018293 [Mycteria americana]